jgi:putative acetyltransferase
VETHLKDSVESAPVENGQGDGSDIERPEYPRYYMLDISGAIADSPLIFEDQMKIEMDDLSRPAIHALLDEHLQSMYELSPPESVHALDLEKLRKPGITFWSAWDGSLLLGCGALKELDHKHGEVKSMRTPAALRRRGAARAILAHIIEVARSRSYDRLSLETGSMEAFKPAQRLYESFGFAYCGPFGEYVEDPNSVFMTMHLSVGGA